MVFGVRRSFVRQVAILAFVAVLVSGVSSEPHDSKLEFVPLRRGVASDVLPDASTFDLILVGESPHYTGEIPRAVSEVLLKELYHDGFHVYMPETNHADGLTLDAYVTGLLDAQDVPPAALILHRGVMDSIREANAQRVIPMRVYGIDMNHFPWAFREAVEFLGLDMSLLHGVTDAIDSQFAGREPPSLIERPLDRVSLARAHAEWAQAERPHLSLYVAKLESAIEDMETNSRHLRRELGTRNYDLLHELLSVEARSARCRANTNAGDRESIMVDLVMAGLASHGGQGIALVGAAHAERTSSRVFTSILYGNRMGDVLSADLNTHHLLAYALAGDRLNGYMSGGTTPFDHRRIYPADNLVSAFARIAREPGFITLSNEASDELWWFGTRKIVPGHHWDSFLIFPVVTIDPELR